MNLLILGGSRFLGKYLVEAGLRAGHEVTVFNRGTSKAAENSRVEQLIGDRDGQLSALQGRFWDAVIDTCGYVPRIVRDSLQLLKDQVNHYTFVSSISVYHDLTKSGTTEDDAVLELPDKTSEDVSLHYGALKALCEQEVRDLMPEQNLIIRPGLIVGPHDYSDRFTYWPNRVAMGGEILVPSPPNRSFQVIDVRDVAEWIIRLVEQKQTGTYHAIGPDLSFDQLMRECQAVSTRAASFVWVEEAFLQEHQVGHWIELPLWIESDGPVGMLSVNRDRAVQAGLTTRPVDETIRDTYAWTQTRPLDYEWKAGLRAGRERELIELWQQRIDSQGNHA